MFESNSPVPDEVAAPPVEAVADSGQVDVSPPLEQSASPDALAVSSGEQGVAGEQSPSEAPPAPDATTLEVPFELDCRQRLALVSLARGSSMTKASQDAGVARSTLYKWVNEHPGFRAAYDRWKAITQMSAHGQVLALQDLAAEVIKEQLEFKRDARLAERILVKTGAMAPPTIGPTHPGRAAAQITAEQREQDVEVAKRAGDAEGAVRYIPKEFRFTDPQEEGR
jgi:transposase